MPILSGRDVRGELLEPGDRVAAPLNPEAIPAERIWRTGAVLGFSPYRAVEPEALILLSRGGDTPRSPAAACWRLGSREEVASG